RPVVDAFLDGAKVRLEFWDGTSLGPPTGAPRLRIRSADALKRMLWAPGELGIARAFVAGDLDADGDLFELVSELKPVGARLRRSRPVVLVPAIARAVARLGLLGLPPSPPGIEARPRGSRHSKGRDAQAVAHHYDVGNAFYRLVLGESMTYSCA